MFVPFLVLALADKPASFKADVAPILAARCLACHNEKKPANGLDMTTFARLKKGGKGAGEEVIVVGSPEASELVAVLREDAKPRMPMKAAPLSDAQIATIARWIKDGAKFDGPSESTTTLASLADPLGNLPSVPPRATTSDPVTSVAFAPDGSKVAVAVGRAVLLFDVRTGKEIATLGDHPGQVNAVEVAPDGKTLVACGGRAGQFGFVTVWDLATKARRHELRGHADAILAADLATDGKTLATGSYDRMVKLWDVAEGREIRTLKEHTDAVHAVVFRRDGARVASGGADRTVKVWDVVTGKRLVSLGDSTGEVYAVAFGPSGDLLYGAGVDRSIRAWELKGQGGVPLKSVFAHDAPVLRMAISSDGQTMVSTGEDKAVKAWDLPNLKPRASLGAQPDWPQALAISPEGSRLAVGRYDGSAAILDSASGKVVTTLREAPKPGAAPKPAGEGDVAEVEPNDEPSATMKATPLPATLAGKLDRPGDTDVWRFEAKRGQILVFETLSRGSSDLVLALLDQDGQTVARASATPTSAEPVVAASLPSDGPLILVVSDAQVGGSGNHAYRIRAGALPHVASVYPLGMTRGKETTVHLGGVNLDTATTSLRSDEPAGTLVPVKARGSTRRVVVAEGEQVSESGDIPDEPARALAIGWPGGASGRIDPAGDADLFRFEAKKGRRVIVEVFGRRLGSPVDPVLEILDAKGRPVPRAVLRPVEETNIAFRDHASTIRSIRLTKWDELAMGDYLLVGRELMRLSALPRNPDDDAVFWGLGNERSDQGERVGFLETTPEQHPMGQPMYKVEIHPPGASFPVGGVAPVTLTYRNDDGGPGFGKDSRVTFDPPADGTYLVRIEDVRGLGGPDSGYHVVVRAPRPDYSISLSADNPQVPKGASRIVRVNLVRIDGFDGAVEVEAEGLPAGITATTVRIEPEAYTADLLLTAADTAPATSPPTWRLVTRSVPRAPADPVIRHELDPGGPEGGTITVGPPPEIKVRATPSRVAIRPGQRVEVTFHVDRGAGFKGRVPIDVRNLPLGVRVLNIGLNGVLITEKQSERTVFLYAESWVTPNERPFFAVGRVESKSADSSSPPIPLVVEPSSEVAVGRARP
jgi:WD40 repeat protein